MDVLTQPRLICAAITASALLLTLPATAQTVDVTRAQTPLVTIQIGNVDEVHVIPLIAYQALVRQGVPTRLLAGPNRTRTQQTAPIYLAEPVPSAVGGGDPLTMTGWSVGVFR